MAFRRAIRSSALSTGEELTSDLIGIGFNFTGLARADANIEDSLFAASVEAFGQMDLRLLAVLSTWLGVHLSWVNVGRLSRLAEAATDPMVRRFWWAVAFRRQSDARFRRLRRQWDGSRKDLLPGRTEFLVKRHGEDERFREGPLRVPAKTLRERAADVATPESLAARHRAYRWRVMVGPTYRADMMALFEEQPDSRPAAVAKATYGSFATAWRVRRDFRIVRAAGNAAVPAPG